MAKYPESLDEMSPPARKRSWWRFIGRHLPGFSVFLLASMLMIVILWPYVVITVPSGEVGVLWRRFYGFDFYCGCFVGRGTTLDPRELREEGLHIIWPWDQLFLYDLRLQSATQTYNAISKDGVSVTAQISVRFQLAHNSVAVLHKFIGPGYLASVVSPEIGSQAREVISQYTAQEVYTSREPIQDKIRDNAQKSLGAHLNKLVQPEAMEELDPKHYNDFLQGSIQILDVLVLSIELPPAIVEAINRQTEQYYMIQEYKFRVEREAEESKRKQIEADGIAAFQRTVSQGISDSYLRWRGIEATLQLALSKNAKIVVIGTGKDGLPIILGNVDTPAAAEPTAQPGASPAPAAKTPSAASSTKPEAAPAEGGSTKAAPPGGSSSNGTSPAPDKQTAGSSNAPGSAEKTAGSSSPIDLSNVESILSRISGALLPSGSGTNSGSEAKAKN
ncbi:MAG TPA: SPFH domain-containing protein [Beijerinckiaceae bacterium]|nr:SPFH domain-containing protein [Beijerinckiaceae bacterium]